MKREVDETQEEEAELAAREMPDRASRMHCAHGEGSPAYRRARPAPGPRHARTEGSGADLAGTEGREGQTDWGADLPEDPAERARCV